MTYAEKIAVDLSRAVGVQPGSMSFHAIVGAVTEVIERCAQEADRGQCGEDCCEAQCSLGDRIRSLTKARP